MNGRARRTAVACAALVLATLVGLRVTHGQGRTTVPAAFDVTEQSIEDLQQALDAGRITSRQLVELYLARIEAYDQRGPALNAIVAVNPRAREAADALDVERAAKGSRGPLHGIPVLVKDNYETVEMPTTAGSIALATFHPERDAFLVRRLKEAGAVILGKTTMHELAAGILTVGSSFGQTRNPYDLDRTPGGSSGGTGAAVAASFAAAGMGSDTCGSIRIPAANNGLVGLRGTQGLSSRTGIVPLSSTQDIGGPLARSIEDLALMLDATVGVDPRDAQTAGVTDRIPESYRAALRPDALRGARIGVVRSLFGSASEDQEVTRIVDRTLASLREAGAEVTDTAIPGLDDLLRDSSMIGNDFKFDLMEYLAGAPDPPVRSLQQILDRGLYHVALETTFRTRNAIESRENEAARRARIKQAMLRRVTEGVLDEQRFDALVYPTLRRRPARIGDQQGGTNCQLSAHSGLPALAVPAGFTDDGVPIGMELLGPPFSEEELLSLGYSIQQTLKLRRQPFSTPPLVAGRRPAPRTTRVEGPGVAVAFTYDVTSARLQYAVTPAPKSTAALTAIWLHSGTPNTPGAARHQIFDVRAGESTGKATGVIAVSGDDRENLREGRMLVRFYLEGAGESVTVHLPEMGAWQ